MSQKKPDESQAEKFKRLAREIGADEDEAAFGSKLRRIAGQKPPKPGKGEKPGSGKG